MSDSSNTILLADGIVGKTYTTLKGVQVQLIRIRETGEPIVMSLITSHTVVYPIDYRVHADSNDDIIVVTEDDSPDKRLQTLFFRVLQASNMSAESLADILPIPLKTIEGELRAVISEAQLAETRS